LYRTLNSRSGFLGRHQPDGAHHLPEIAQDWISLVRVKVDPHRHCFNRNLSAHLSWETAMLSKNRIFSCLVIAVLGRPKTIQAELDRDGCSNLPARISFPFWL
jgi:hypothetical protein